jgi:putative membrane protein
MVGGFGFLWMLLWALMLIGIPVGISYLILSGRASKDDGTDDALDLLRQRYAQGEIDEEEFDTRRGKLLAEQN